MSGLVRIPLAHQVYLELRAQIVSGQLPSGMRLLPEDLAESMAISQTPVKEALVRLAADGLVDAPSRRGAVVRRFSAGDVRELYEARILIEQHAVRAALANQGFTPAVIAELRRILADHVIQIERHTDDGLRNALALDREFHARLVALGGNGFIGEWHTKIMQQTHTVMVYSSADYTVHPTVREHEELLAALAAGKHDEAARALDRHLARSRDDMLTHVGEREARLSEAKLGAIKPEDKDAPAGDG
jgi:DNA-binding GntR family transcriptional regulator